MNLLDTILKDDSFDELTRTIMTYRIRDKLSLRKIAYILKITDQTVGLTVKHVSNVFKRRTYEAMSSEKKIETEKKNELIKQALIYYEGLYYKFGVHGKIFYLSNISWNKSATVTELDLRNEWIRQAKKEGVKNKLLNKIKIKNHIDSGKWKNTTPINAIES